MADNKTCYPLILSHSDADLLERVIEEKMQDNANHIEHYLTIDIPNFPRAKALADENYTLRSLYASVRRASDRVERDLVAAEMEGD